MTTIEISKADIIKALKTEPLLRAGAWYDITFCGPVGGECHVCAVGAVMRAHLGQRQHAGRISDAARSACEGSYAVRGEARLALQELRAGRPMAALSCVFEHAEDAHGGGGEAGRAAAIAFVRKHFPNRVRFSIDGARPRRGVKVVKER